VTTAAIELLIVYAMLILMGVYLAIFANIITDPNIRILFPILMALPLVLVLSRTFFDLREIQSFGTAIRRLREFGKYEREVRSKIAELERRSG
jgi:hypothetical protein